MNLENLLLTLLSIINVKPILKKHTGRFWLLFLINSSYKGSRLFNKTKWKNKKTDEAKFVKSMMLLPAMYLKLKKKFQSDKAFEIMNEIIISVSFTFDNNTSKKHNLFIINDPFERWLKYRSTLIANGFGAFNDIDDVYISKERIHYVVNRCIFNDFFTETGTPELTKLICDYDKLYHSGIFKEFYFDRNGSWNNTIGYGNKICHYVWKDKNLLNEDFKKSLEKENELLKEDERRRNERRQFDRRQNDRRQFDRRKIN